MLATKVNREWEVGNRNGIIKGETSAVLKKLSPDQIPKSMEVFYIKWKDKSLQVSTDLTFHSLMKYLCFFICPDINFQHWDLHWYHQPSSISAAQHKHTERVHFRRASSRK